MPHEAAHNLGERSIADELPVPAPGPPTDHEVPSEMWESNYLGETSGAYPRTPQPSMAMVGLTSGQGETSKAYPRTPQPSMAMASPTSGLSQGFRRSATISEEAEEVPQAPPGHLPPITSENPGSRHPTMGGVSEAQGPDEGAGGSIAHAESSGSQGDHGQTGHAAAPLKQYTSDIGGGEGLAEFAMSVQQDRQQLLKRYTSDIGGGEGLADFAATMNHQDSQLGRQQTSSEGPARGSEGQSTGPAAASKEMRRVTSDIGGGEELAAFARLLQPVPETQPLAPDSSTRVSAGTLTTQRSSVSFSAGAV